MKNNSIFERYEIKYLITNRQRKIIMRAMQHRMKPDDYGKSTICNIYYDTPDFYLIRHSLEKPVYKEKLRVRREEHQRLSSGHLTICGFT